MITDQQRSELRSLVRGPLWGAVLNLAQDLQAKIREEGKIQDTEWDTVRAILTSEGKIAGITQLLQEVGKESVYE